LSSTFSASLGRHTLRATYRDMQFQWQGRRERQQSREIEDLLSFRSLMLGIGARWDSARSESRRNSLYFRGSFQYRYRLLSAYAFAEAGNDLLNRTVFATNTISTTVIGLSARVARDWQLNAEGFRSRMTASLHPENIFILQGQGVGYSPVLMASNQWTFYARLSRRLNWGGALPSDSNLPVAAARETALHGSVEGVVEEKTDAGLRPVGGIAVSLDGSQVAETDAQGRYRFASVPEGEHRLVFGAGALPADFEPAGDPLQIVRVTANRAARANFVVLRLTEIRGRVDAVTLPQDRTLDMVMIRLKPGARYTSPDEDGAFGFYNLPPGRYEVQFDAWNLANQIVVESPESVAVDTTAGDPAPVAFRIKGKEAAAKPVRKVFEKTMEQAPPPDPAPQASLRPGAQTAPVLAVAAPAAPKKGAGKSKRANAPTKRGSSRAASGDMVGPPLRLPPASEGLTQAASLPQPASESLVLTRIPPGTAVREAASGAGRAGTSPKARLKPRGGRQPAPPGRLKPAPPAKRRGGLEPSPPEATGKFEGAKPASAATDAGTKSDAGRSAVEQGPLDPAARAAARSSGVGAKTRARQVSSAQRRLAGKSRARAVQSSRKPKTAGSAGRDDLHLESPVAARPAGAQPVAKVDKAPRKGRFARSGKGARR
jgi:hypothetical protein